MHNTDDKSLHGLSWGWRRFYKWILDGDGKVTNADAEPEKLRVMNRALYIGLSGLQIWRAPPHALFGLEQQGGGRWADLPPGRVRGR